MFDLTVHKRFKYVLFSSLYIAEGLYQTLLILITPLYLLEKNVPIPLITIIIGIGQAPWALKFLWGGIIDYYQKYGRKKFTVLGTLIGGFGFVILAAIDHYFSLLFFTLFLFIGHIGIGFLDAGADAWAIDISTKEDRGKINGFMWIGQSMSASIGGPIMVIIGLGFGYNIAFLLVGLLIIILSIAPLMVRYINRNLKNIEILPLVKQEFSKKSTRRATFYLFIIALHPSLILSLFVIIGKTVLYWDDTFIALTGVLSLFVGTIPGGILGGFIADKIGRKKPLYFFLPMLVLTSLAIIILIHTNLYMILAWLIIVKFLWAAMTAANWAMIMDIINPKIGAAQHEIICSIANTGVMTITAAAGTLFVVLGFNNVFFLSVLIIISALIVLNFIKSKDIK
jgi:MFS family permease